MRTGEFESFKLSFFGRYRLWLWLGLAIVVFGTFPMMTLRDINEVTLTNLQLAGDTRSPSFQGAQVTESLIAHSNEQIILLGLGFLKLGIGSAIFMIVYNLVATGDHTRTTFESIGAPRVAMSRPWFLRVFPIFLLLGIAFDIFNVGVLVSIWDANLLRLLGLEVSGQTAGAAFQQALTVERFIGISVVPVELAGATLLIAGIAFGLASIIYNLRLQGKNLPIMLKMAMGTLAKGEEMSQAAGGQPTPLLSRGFIGAILLGFFFGISQLVFINPLRYANLSNLLSEQFASRTTSDLFSSALAFESSIGITTEQWVFVGIGILVLSINFLLLRIIHALRAQRQSFNGLLADTGTEVTPVEKPIWTTKVVPSIASIGFLAMLINFILSLLAASARLTALKLQSVGQGGSEAFRQAVFSDTTFTIFTRNLKLLGFGVLLLAVGFSLITIIINLRLTAMTLPTMFTMILQFITSGRAKGTQAEKIQLPSPLSFAQWKLFVPIAIGVVLTVLPTLPLSFVESASFVTYKTLEFAGQTNLPQYGASLLTERLLEHSLLPMKTLGLGIVFVGIGRTFAFILETYVKARRTLLREGVESVVSAFKRK